MKLKAPKICVDEHSSHSWYST